MPRSILVIAPLLASAALAACGGSDSAAAPETTATAPSGQPAQARSTPAEARPVSVKPVRRPGSTVSVHKTAYGRVLSDGRGRALYLFTKDRRGPSRCFGRCADAWPPFLTKGTPHTAGAARASLVGSVARRGSRRQVTYGGRPLYYYVGDDAPGVVRCQNVFEFGGLWLVVSPDGSPVR